MTACRQLVKANLKILIYSTSPLLTPASNLRIDLFLPNFLTTASLFPENDDLTIDNFSLEKYDPLRMRIGNDQLLATSIDFP